MDYKIKKEIQNELIHHYKQMYKEGYISYDEYYNEVNTLRNYVIDFIQHDLTCKIIDKCECY